MNDYDDGAAVRVDLETEICEGRHTRIKARLVQLFFDAQKLVVLGNTFTSRRRARLNLTGIQRHNQIGNRRVLRFAAAM